MTRSLLLCALIACGGSSVDSGDQADADNGFDFADADPNAPDAGPGMVDPNGPECNNGIDDDNDGLVDGFDPECTGLSDDDEGSFATGIPGDNRSNSGYQDCFFDGNSGSGNDGCRVPDCCFDGTCPGSAECTPTQQCIDNCSPLAPPGCDCFGCCTVCDGPNCEDIFLPTDANDPCQQENLAACTTCTKVEACGGSCDNDECELCPGQTVDDLPPSCTDAACADGNTVCTSNSDCLANEYCSSGCCIGGIEID